jgi:hypothetical protein
VCVCSIKLWNVAGACEVREVFDRKMGIGGKHRADVRRIVLLGDASPVASPSPSPGRPGPPQPSLHALTASLDGTVKTWRLHVRGHYTLICYCGYG